LAVSAAERSASRLLGARQITVTFADIAGFTQLGEALAPEELEHVASRLAQLARDVAVAPVRFIKTIGDAVMLVSSEPAPLLHSVLDLAAAAAANGLPSLRIGVASGKAVSRAGDWFGSPVNVASRIAQAARPGTVLVAESARDAVASHPAFEWESAGARRFKGVKDDVTLFRIRRSGPDTTIGSGYDDRGWQPRRRYLNRERNLGVNRSRGHAARGARRLAGRGCRVCTRGPRAAR
jgi:adenylate cyclase